MRGIVAFIGAYLVLALLWTLYAPINSHRLVQQLSEPEADLRLCEDELRRQGAGAVGALQNGLNVGSAEARLRCAQLLALAGHEEGERHLLAALHEHGRKYDDPAGVLAEAFLLSLWVQREAPPAPVLQRLLNLDLELRPDTEKLKALSEALTKNPFWASGYIRRARLYQNAGDHAKAREDALTALKLIPDHYEAMVVLAETFMLLQIPSQACLCLEQALRVNPRLKRVLHGSVLEVLKAHDAEKARRRREHRKEMPII